LAGSFAFQALHAASSMENESTTENLNHFNMWIAKPIYESLPYFYLLAGIISLGLSMYLNYWYMPTICFVVGLSTTGLLEQDLQGTIAGYVSLMAES
jgi:hypothetical protein